jgi:hypothetical protein
VVVDLRLDAPLFGPPTERVSGERPEQRALDASVK